MSKPLSPEFKLLCSLLPVHFRGGLPWPSDWRGLAPAAFFAYAAKTQVAPLALHHWETRCPALWDATPFEVRARIIAWQELFHHKQMARLASWRELLSAFAAANLPVIPLKGFVLSQYLYADPFLRQSCDFDLLVQRSDVERAFGLLHDLGFKPGRWLGLNAAGETSWGRDGSGETEAVNLDLHWALQPRWYFYSLPAAAAWERQVTFETAGVRHAALDPADTVLFALFNNIGDYGLSNLRGCSEIVESLARLSGADVDAFQQRLDSLGAGRLLTALEIFRVRFFPGSDAAAVGRFRSPARIAGSELFGQESLYAPGPRPSWPVRLGLRLTLAGPSMRLPRYIVGKLGEVWRTRRHHEVPPATSLPNSSPGAVEPSTLNPQPSTPAGTHHPDSRVREAS